MDFNFFLHTEAAVLQAAMLMREEWIKAARSGRFRGANTGWYLAGLRGQNSIEYPMDGDPLLADVVNRAPLADVIEHGHPSFHLPSVIRWGRTPASKRSKKGSWYIRIPFDHTAPRKGREDTDTTIPPMIYAAARRLKPGQYLTAGRTIRGGRARHAEGMTPYVPRHPANIRPGYTHVSRHERLQRSATRKFKMSFVTFRTITPHSPGWTIPAQEGTHIAETVQREVTPRVQALIEAALVKDIQVALDFHVRMFG